MFTWDEAKRKLNLAKHGIDFHDAAAIFEGPLVVIEGHTRRLWRTAIRRAWSSRGIVVSLVYTERNDQVRLISIRKALKHETRFFLSKIGK